MALDLEPEEPVRESLSTFEDGDTVCPGKSAPASPPTVRPEVLQVYQTGELTVVGFGGMDVPDEVCVAAYRDQLANLLSGTECSVLAFDCSGVKLMPSGMLGLLLTLRKQVNQVELYNPSKDIVEVLKLTNLLPLFEVKMVEMSV